MNISLIDQDIQAKIDNLFADYDELIKRTKELTEKIDQFDKININKIIEDNLC